MPRPSFITKLSSFHYRTALAQCLFLPIGRVCIHGGQVTDVPEPGPQAGGLRGFIMSIAVTGRAEDYYCAIPCCPATEEDDRGENHDAPNTPDLAYGEHQWLNLGFEEVFVPELGLDVTFALYMY